MTILTKADYIRYVKWNRRLKVSRLSWSAILLSSLLLAGPASAEPGSFRLLLTLVDDRSSTPRETLPLNVRLSQSSSGRKENQARVIAERTGQSKAAQAPVPFEAALKKALKARRMKRETVCSKDDPLARRILDDYGAVFVAASNVTPPPACIFANEAQVLEFQNRVRTGSATIGDARIELQQAALDSLLKAREAALAEGLDITPRGGSDAARRSYADTLFWWNSRVQPALDYWIEEGELTADEAAHVRALPVREQVLAVLDLERRGIFFSLDFSKSILYSVAAPGASQHLAMLAFDVTEFEEPRVRSILAEHGWFQTVASDLPHFTYLGLNEDQLPAHGLRAVDLEGQTFWIPNVTE